MRFDFSFDEVERIGKLEGTIIGAVAVEIALLVADVGNDRVTRGPDLGAFSALERYDRWIGIAVRPGDELGPTLISGVIQVQQRRIALTVTAAGDEKQRDIPGS